MQLNTLDRDEKNATDQSCGRMSVTDFNIAYIPVARE